MEVEPVDIQFWRGENLFTVWQAAFLMCHLEPWDEPISSIANVPDLVETMRMKLLVSIPHYKTREVFAQSGWSCKTHRPAKLSGSYFKRDELIEWAKEYFLDSETPLFIGKEAALF